jgi:hypothetical protein
MGFIGSLLGTKSGNTGGAGMNYAATGVDPEQLKAAYQQVQSGLGQQQNFINLLNQQVQGGGPNPAQLQFGQNIDTLNQQQAGAISSQKGISPALAARLIAMQGGAAKQNAAGDAATLQAQQQIQAQNQLQNALGGYNQTALGQQQNLMGLQGSANSANAGVSQVTARGQQDIFKGFTDAAGKAIGMADGGMVPEDGPRSAYGRHMMQMKSGGMVPGQAPVSGDSPKNDKVPAMLSPKEIVLPRSITMSDNAPEKAAAFVAAILAKNGLKK